MTTKSNGEDGGFRFRITPPGDALAVRVELCSINAGDECSSVSLALRERFASFTAPRDSRACFASVTVSTPDGEYTTAGEYLC